MVVSNLPMKSLQQEKNYQKNIFRCTSVTMDFLLITSRVVARTIIGGFGDDLVHARISQSISKEIRRAEHEYISIHPPPSYRSSYGSHYIVVAKTKQPKKHS